MFPSNNRVSITTKNQSPSSCGTAVNGVRFYGGSLYRMCVNINLMVLSLKKALVVLEFSYIKALMVGLQDCIGYGNGNSVWIP